MRNATGVPSFINVGSIVTVPIKRWLGLVSHYAIVTNKRGLDGMPIVVANSAYTGGPSEELWDQFAQGQPCKDSYYPSNLPPELVLYNAYRMFGTRYDLLSWNCEHFVNACHHLPVTSKQVTAFAFTATLGCLALAVPRS